MKYYKSRLPSASLFREREKICIKAGVYAGIWERRTPAFPSNHGGYFGVPTWHLLKKMASRIPRHKVTKEITRLRAWRVKSGYPENAPVYPEGYTF